MSYLKCKHWEHKNVAKSFNFENTTTTTLTLVPQIRDCNRQVYIEHDSKPWGKYKTRVQLKAAIGITYSRSRLCSTLFVFVYNINSVTVAGCNQKIFQTRTRWYIIGATIQMTTSQSMCLAPRRSLRDAFDAQT